MACVRLTDEVIHKELTLQFDKRHGKNGLDQMGWEELYMSPQVLALNAVLLLNVKDSQRLLSLDEFSFSYIIPFLEKHDK